VNLLVLCVILLAAIALSAAFSTAESALFSLGSVRLRRMKLRRRLTAPLVRSLLVRPRRLLITIIVGNTFTLTVAAAVAAALGARAGVVYGPLVAAVLITAVLFIFAEMVPKALGVTWPERGAAVTSPFITSVYWLLYPLNRAVVALANFAAGGFTYRSIDPGPEDIYGLLVEGKDDGVLDGTEKELIEQVVSFGDRTAGEIATPRTKIFGLPAELSFEEGARAAAAAGYTRIPLFNGDIENVVGILYAKDILLAEAQPPATLASLARAAHFVPASQPAVNLFWDFVRNRTHIALVVDEYGALDGLVTMADVLGGIFGEPPPAVTYLGGRRFTVAADTGLDDFNDLTGSYLEDKAADTIGGYVLNRLGRIPAAGEEYREGELRIVVKVADPHRLVELMVEVSPREGT